MLAGALFWSALGGLWAEVSPRGRKQTLWVFAVSLPGLIVAGLNPPALSWERVLSANTVMLSMLVSVGFVSMAAETGSDRNVTGVKGLLSTFANVHLVGAIINFSAVVVFGDRLARSTKLDTAQCVVLSRAFSSAGFWSPFFATTAVAFTYAPDADVSRVLFAGISLSVLSLLFCVVDLHRSMQRSSFMGSSLSIKGLRKPLAILLAVSVLHAVRPGLSIPSIIIFVCPAVACLWIRPWRRVPVVFAEHVRGRIPGQGTELALFLSAGLLGVSLMALLEAVPLGIAWPQFGAFEAAIGLFCVITLSLVGVHPLISLSVLARVAETTHASPTILAFAIVSSWSISSAVGPLSGQNLAIQGRYGIDGVVLSRRNGAYAAWMTLAAIACLYLLE